jgi:carboxymethylenebutenolidase
VAAQARAPPFRRLVNARHLVTAVFPCNRIRRESQHHAQTKKPRESSNAMQERQVDIPTKDGKTTTFIVHPDRGGPFPVILFYMDAPAIREELRDMARRFATSGYYVVLPNMYYRAGVMELGPLPTDANDPKRKKMFDLMNSLTIPLVMEDTDAILRFIESDTAASKGAMGTVGYCMSGQYATAAAVRYPDRVMAAGSIYGTRLVTDAPDSPHLTAKKAKAELYFGCAEHDTYAPMEMVETLRQQLRADDVKAEIEVYPGVHHGFAFPQRAAYDKPAAEQHWERLLALYKRRLKA